MMILVSLFASYLEDNRVLPCFMLDILSILSPEQTNLTLKITREGRLTILSLNNYQLLRWNFQIKFVTTDPHS